MGYTGLIKAVHLSVCLSVEKWFPQDNSISFWHTMTSILQVWTHLFPVTQGAPLFIWGQEAKGQGQI